LPNAREDVDARDKRRHDGGEDRPGSALGRPLLLIAAGAGVLVAATIALWAHYGTAVFYEVILAGLAACL
jgi:hypothetical protein